MHGGDDVDELRRRCAKRSPPSAGPTTVPLWKAIERSAIALGSSSHGTSDGPSARAGRVRDRRGDAVAAASTRNGQSWFAPAIVTHEQEQRRRSTLSASAAAKTSRRGNAVGELAGRQREQEQRQELAEPDQAEVERRVVDREDLPADATATICMPKPSATSAIQSRR